MKWFGRKSARDAARLPLSRAGMFAGFGEWPRSYEAQVREGYCQNPVAQRAVKLVAEGVGGAALDGSDPALVALVTARSGGQPLTETVAAQILMHGRPFCGSILQCKVPLSLRARTRRPPTPLRGRAGSWAKRRKGPGRVVRIRSRAGPWRDGGSSSLARECGSGSPRILGSPCFQAENGRLAGVTGVSSSRGCSWWAHARRR